MKKLMNTVYLLTPDSYLSLDGENLVIRMQDGNERRLPLHNLEGVVAFGSRGASPALLGKCAEYGIAFSFLSRSGKFLARTVGGVSGNVFLRREQYRRQTAANAVCGWRGTSSPESYSTAGTFWNAPSGITHCVWIRKS